MEGQARGRPEIFSANEFCQLSYGILIGIQGARLKSPPDFNASNPHTKSSPIPRSGLGTMLHGRDPSPLHPRHLLPTREATPMPMLVHNGHHLPSPQQLASQEPLHRHTVRRDTRTLRPPSRRHIIRRRKARKLGQICIQLGRV